MEVSYEAGNLYCILLKELLLWKADDKLYSAFVNYSAATIIVNPRNSWREEDRAAWIGAASRACGARGGRRDTLGGAAAPPEPPRFFFPMSFLTFFGA